MTLQASVLELFTCNDLEGLLQRVSTESERLGYPYLVLRWSPAATTDNAMISNSLPVWSNFSERLGKSGYDLTEALSESIEFGLKQARGNTIERQDWISQQLNTFSVSQDAPKHFLLTQYEQNLICDFGEKVWTEFVSHPLCRERDRLLRLEAMTHEDLSDETATSARQIFIVFETMYRRLKTLASTPVAANDGDPSKSYLSHRELECLSWLAAGKTLQEAAMILEISERTLRFHIANARNRLGVATTMQAVVAAALTYGFDPSDTRRSVYSASRRSRFKAV